jgi:hypothetical protein
VPALASLSTDEPGHGIAASGADLASSGPRNFTLNNGAENHSQSGAHVLGRRAKEGASIACDSGYFDSNPYIRYSPIKCTTY